jgi:hypothetical protein
LNYLNVEVDGTESSPSVSVPCFQPPFSLPLALSVFKFNYAAHFKSKVCPFLFPFLSPFFWVFFSGGIFSAETWWVDPLRTSVKLLCTDRKRYRETERERKRERGGGRVPKGRKLETERGRDRERNSF